MAEVGVSNYGVCSSDPLDSIKGKVINEPACTGPEGSRRLRFPDFKPPGTRRWQGCQP